MFSEQYYGIPSNVSDDAVNVTGIYINPNNWNTICDLSYWDPMVSCQDSWKVCNPANDLAQRRPLQRGGGTSYIPNVNEVTIAIAAPEYI